MRWTRALVVLAVPLAAACSHAKQEVKAEEAPPAAAEPAPAPAPPDGETAVQTPPAAKSCSADEDCAANELCISSTCQPIVPGMAECASASAYFDLDQSTLQDRDLPALRRAARCLQAGSSKGAVVAGYCDERGTAQYNVALGFRRAAAVQTYLTGLGVPKAQLRTVSYGKERPVCTDSNEECWARNRRGEISGASSP